MPQDQTMLAWFQNEWAAGRLTKPQDAVMQLLQSPETFLRKHPVVNTFDCSASGQTRAYLRNDRADAQRPGTKLGTLNMKTTESFNLEMISGVNAYGYAFPVHGIYTSPGSGGAQWYTLDGSGPATMLTAKLTGCTFVVRAGPGASVQVTHLQPDQNIDGLALNAQMKGPGRAAYGRLRYDYDKRSINVIGIRSGAQWRIWAQKLEKNSTTPRILSLNRIWPL